MSRMSHIFFGILVVAVTHRSLSSELRCPNKETPRTAYTNITRKSSSAMLVNAGTEAAKMSTS